MTDMRLAEKVLARGLVVTDGEPAWEAYHLAKDVLELRAAIEDYILWEPGRAGHAAAHRRLVAALSQQEAGRE